MIKEGRKQQLEELAQKKAKQAEAAKWESHAEERRYMKALEGMKNSEDYHADNEGSKLNNKSRRARNNRRKTANRLKKNGKIVPDCWVTVRNFYCYEI